MLFPIARVGVQVLNPLNVSEPLVGKQWALDAHKFFLERQIRLIQFYEHELVQRFGQVKNYIARAVGYIEKWIPVEGLEVVELSAEEAKVFFAAHHIKSVQVNGSALRLGLRQAGVLVAAAVFGRRGKDMMLRGYCEKDRIVVGNGLLAMCDIARSAFGPLSASLPIRLDDGGLFLGNGWTVDRLGAPGHGLVDLNGNIAPGTRQSATESADFVKFYDAGKIFFVFA
jgi:hypothetical protein